VDDENADWRCGRLGIVALRTRSLSGAPSTCSTKCTRDSWCPRWVPTRRPPPWCIEPAVDPL